MRRTENVISLLLFLGVFSIYSYLVNGAIDFWDTGEFVTTNYHLEATHPSGASFYTLWSRFLINFFPSEHVIWVCGMISAFFSSISVVLVYRIVRIFALKIRNNINSFVVELSGIISALTLAFSNTFWSISISVEVYSMTVFFVLLIFYLIILWLDIKDVKLRFKFLLLIGLLLGLSIGIHLTNLSVIIPVVFVIICKAKGISFKNVLIATIISVLSFFVVHKIAFLGFFKLASLIDIRLVNDFRTPVHSGLLLLIILIFGGAFWMIRWSVKNEKILVYKFVLLGVYFFVGFSVCLLPLFRNGLNTPFAYEINSTEDLLNYLTAKQFGVHEVPLLKGKVFNAPLDKKYPFLDSNPIWKYDLSQKKYIVTDDGKFSKINYAEEYSMFFPRMHSQKKQSIKEYYNWVPIKGEECIYPIQGENRSLMKPTYKENFLFFKNYQLNWIYLRFLFWNFVGRQNDYKGEGHAMHGNWVSGIDFFDETRVGKKESWVKHYKLNKSYDVYYFLPFLLGLIGLWVLRKNKLLMLSSLILFFLFGFGIVIYGNFLPESILVRERDYIYVVSFSAFAMWVGLSFLELENVITKLKTKKYIIPIVGIVVFVLSPLQLFCKNWNQFSLKESVFARNLAKQYLYSCPKDAILITNGDNFTFPLWYLQEVEGYRQDVRVVNFDQLNLDFYVEKLKAKVFESKPLKLNLDNEFYREGKPRLLPFKQDLKKPVDIFYLMKFLNADETRLNWNGKKQHYIPSDKFFVSVDTLNPVFSNLNTKGYKSKFVSKIEFQFSREFYKLSEIVLMDLIQSNVNERAICFLMNGDKNHYIGLNDRCLLQKGNIEQLVPIVKSSEVENPKNVDVEMGEKIFNESQLYKGIDLNDFYLGPEVRDYVQVVLRRNVYFTAQALIEKGENKRAIQLIDKCFKILPNDKVLFKQYAFSLGKLYLRTGEKEKGEKVCLKSAENIKLELEWLLSFNPESNQILNVNKAVKLKEMYIQMMDQMGRFKIEKSYKLKAELNDLLNYFSVWKIKNWPY